ncbi:MAG: aspartate ammonia-lyase [Deltaproteobacteria bacterium]|nr:aspartate ammonia-lyase [Deltaproteobacteria bacterium]
MVRTVTSRKENDLLGARELPDEALYGIHTLRAMENFPLTGRPVHEALICAFGMVKLACARTNADLGWWREEPAKAQSLARACQEMAEGLLSNAIRVDALQGGAGTSTNMAVNEVLANRALELMGEPRGAYHRLSPLDDVNLHQSTNDTYPTALRLAAIRSIRQLEERVIALVEAFQLKEKQFAQVVKVGRTEYQDAVLTTLGREMGAYAEAFARDRWRIYKCEERLRVVNLGGTAIGTGLAAPRQYIFRVVDTLRELTGIGFARAENLVESTQNADVFVEVSGILKACAASLLKVCGDLRLLSSGPEAGLGEIRLPALQAGSSIMPGKVNPVIPEAVSQAAMLTIGYDSVLTNACAQGSLELNAFLPLIAECLLTSCDLLGRACELLACRCVTGIEADEARCRAHVEASTAVATALIGDLGYEQVCAIVQKSIATQRSVREIAVGDNWLSSQAFNALITPEAVCRLGTPDTAGRSKGEP